MFNQTTTHKTGEPHETGMAGGIRSRVDFGHQTVVIRRGGVAMRWALRTITVCMILLGMTVLVTAGALMLGDYPLSLRQLWSPSSTPPMPGFARTVVMEWRAPRAFAAVVFGATLGASGAVFQSLTQ